jgi:hypothetical protein
MSNKINDWRAIDAQMERIILAEDKEPFGRDVISQARDFLQVIRDRCAVPAVGKGYWNTIIFDWGPLQVEVFGDRFELYRFADRRTDIRHVPHRLGEPLPPELISELPVP